MGDKYARHDLDGIGQSVGSTKQVCARKDKDKETRTKARRNRAEDQGDVQGPGQVSAVKTGNAGGQRGGIQQVERILSLDKLGESVETTVCAECGRLPPPGASGIPLHSNIPQACHLLRVPGARVGKSFVGLNAAAS